MCLIKFLKVKLIKYEHVPLTIHKSCLYACFCPKCTWAHSGASFTDVTFIKPSAARAGSFAVNKLKEKIFDLQYVINYFCGTNNVV